MSQINFEELTKLANLDLTKFEGNEQNIKYNIVLRFLNCFGYDRLDLEHAAQGSRVDINLGNKIIVETKALDKNLDNYISQVQQYCSNERPDLAILTNGKLYKFYSPFMRVPSFGNTLIYEFLLTDFSNEEVAIRINKIIGLENYKNKTYQTYIEERETELKQVRNFIDDHDRKKTENIEAIQNEIEKLKSEMAKLDSETKLKQQEIEQIKSKKIPEKEELFKKHFIPATINSQLSPVFPPQTRIVTQPVANDNLKIYKINKVKDGVNASGRYYDNKKFIVLKNSTVSLELDASFGKGAADGAFELRKDLEKTGIIDANRQFIEDYTFNSISQAACVVLGGSRNGLRTWE
jgi:predicted type IV restriction endonuclease